MANCAFCDKSKKLTNEHVLSAPIHELIEADGPFRVGIGRTREGFTNIVADYESKTLSAFKRKAFCADCNGGWMQELDHEVASTLAPMVRGEPKALNRNERDLVSIWATKMALVVESLSAKDREVAPEVFHTFYADRVPIGVEPIQLAHYVDPERARATYVRRLVQFKQRKPSGETATVEVVLVTVIVGALILQIALPGRSRILAPPIADNGSDRIRIWPPSDELLVPWPPPSKVTYADLDDFSDASWAHAR